MVTCRVTPAASKVAAGADEGQTVRFRAIGRVKGGCAKTRMPLRWRSTGRIEWPVGIGFLCMTDMAVGRSRHLRSPAGQDRRAPDEGAEPVAGALLSCLTNRP